MDAHLKYRDVQKVFFILKQHTYTDLNHLKNMYKLWYPTMKGHVLQTLTAKCANKSTKYDMSIICCLRIKITFCTSLYLKCASIVGVLYLQWKGWQWMEKVFLPQMYCRRTDLLRGYFISVRKTSFNKHINNHN